MGLRCLLISTNKVVNPYPVYPLGIAHLAGALGEAGHGVSFFDLLASGGIANLDTLLKDTEFDLIGVSIRNIDTEDSNAPSFFFSHLAEVMFCIRKRSQAPVVLGGPAFSIMAQELFELLKADYGIVGEGEILLPWLANQIAIDSRPKREIFHAGHDAPPLPVCYDRAISEYYIKWGGMLNIQTKRGCPHKCAYCLYPTLEGTKLRCREPLAVADDVMRLTREFDARYVFFTDAVFNDHQGHYLQVAEALVKAGNKTPWCAFFRPSNFKKEELALLKKAGLSAIELGTDASSDATLQGLNKKFSFADVLLTNDVARKLEIPCAHFIIFGGPGETPETLNEGLKNVERLGEMVVFGFNGIRVLPGSGVEKTAIAQGLLHKGQSLLEPFYYFSPESPKKMVNEMLEHAWASRRERVYPCSAMEGKVKTLHQFGHCGPLWDLLVT